MEDLQEKLDPLQNLGSKPRQDRNPSLSGEAVNSIGSYQARLLRKSDRFSSTNELRMSETVLVMEKKARAFDMLMSEDEGKAQEYLKKVEKYL